VDRRSRTAEIRIDRVRTRDDGKLAEKALTDFLATLAPVLDPAAHLVPVAIRPGFGRIVAARDETFMATDLAADSSARQMLTSRREGQSGQDIRLHKNWHLDGDQYVRDSVNVYWALGNEKPDVHTIIRAVKTETSPVEYAKVYVPAHVPEADLKYVISRIRHFAS